MIYSNDGIKLSHIFLISHDVTNTVSYEQAIKQSQQIFRAKLNRKLPKEGAGKQLFGMSQ